MARPPKGKPLTMRTVRLDEDVWAEFQKLGKQHGTINEGLRERLFYITDKQLEETRVIKAMRPFSREDFETDPMCQAAAKWVGQQLKPKDRK